MDAIYVGEYIYKDLWATALLYAAFVPWPCLGCANGGERRTTLACRLHYVPERLAIHVAPQLIGRDAQ